MSLVMFLKIMAQAEIRLELIGWLAGPESASESICTNVQ